MKGCNKKHLRVTDEWFEIVEQSSSSMSRNSSLSINHESEPSLSLSSSSSTYSTDRRSAIVERVLKYHIEESK